MGDLFLLTVLSSGGGGPGIVACGWECSNPCLLPAPATVGCEPSPGREMTQSSHSRQRGEGKENHPLIRATLFLIIHSGTYLVLGTVLSALYVVPHFTNVQGFPGSSVVKNMPAMQEIQKIWVRSLGGEDPLEEEIATHFSILAWRTPWTEESGGLQSMGLQRAGQD